MEGSMGNDVYAMVGKSISIDVCESFEDGYKIEAEIKVEPDWPFIVVTRKDRDGEQDALYIETSIVHEVANAMLEMAAFAEREDAAWSSTQDFLNTTRIVGPYSEGV